MREIWLKCIRVFNLNLGAAVNRITERAMWQDFALTLLTRLSLRVILALSVIVVARYQSATGVGIMTLVRVIPAGMILLTSLGIGAANPYLIGQKKFSLQAIAGNSILAGLVVGAANLLLWYALTPFLQIRFFPQLDSKTVLLIGIIPVADVLQRYFVSILQGLEEFREANLVIFLKESSFLVVYAIVATVENELYWIVLAGVYTSIFSLLVAMYLVWRKGISILPTFHKELLYESVHYGVRAQFGSVFNYMNYRLDFIILALLANTELVGYYAIASKMAEFLRLISTSLFYILFPKFAKSPREISIRLGLKLYKPTMLVITILCAFSFFLIEPVVFLLYGKDFYPSVLAFRLLLPGMVALGANGVLSSFNAGTDKPEYNTFVVAVALCATVALDLLLIPNYGIIGAALASTVAYTMTGALLAWIFIKTNNLKLGQLLGF